MSVSKQQLAEIERGGGKVRLKPRNPTPANTYDEVGIRSTASPIGADPQTTAQLAAHVSNLTGQVADLTSVIQQLADRVAEIEGREGAIVNIEYKDIQGSPFPRMSTVKVEYT